LCWEDKNKALQDAATATIELQSFFTGVFTTFHPPGFSMVPRHAVLEALQHY